MFIFKITRAKDYIKYKRLVLKVLRYIVRQLFIVTFAAFLLDFRLLDVRCLTRDSPYVSKIGFRQMIGCKKATYIVYNLTIDICTDTSPISLTHLIFLQHELRNSVNIKLMWCVAKNIKGRVAALPFMFRKVSLESTFSSSFEAAASVRSTTVATIILI